MSWYGEHLVVGGFRIDDFLVRLCYTRAEWGYHYLLIERLGEDTRPIETMRVDSLDQLAKVIEASRAMIDWSNGFMAKSQLQSRLADLGLCYSASPDPQIARSDPDGVPDKVRS